MAKRLEILIVSGDLKDKCFEVPAAGLRLGRSSSNDIHIPDEELSRNHCLFECSGETGVTVTDLASANGTFVNGENIGAAMRELKAGDEIQVGQTVINVKGEAAAPAAAAAAPAVAAPAVTGGKDVDLGFGPAAGTNDAVDNATRKKASAKSKIIMLIIVGILMILIGLELGLGLLSGLFTERTSSGDKKPEKPSDRIISFLYEKVEADESRVFRYRVELGFDGNLVVEFDDLPDENRHVPPEPKKITEGDMEVLKTIFADETWKQLKPEYRRSASKLENSITYRRIKLVRANEVKEVVVENVPEPEGMAELRTRLELWGNNVLGVHSIARSRADLEKSSKENEDMGDEKWDQRDVQEGNLSEAIACYILAKKDLESLRSSSGNIDRIQGKIDKAEKELGERYERISANAKNLRDIGELERAREEYLRIREMIPRRDDVRHISADQSIRLIEGQIRASEKKGKRR